MELNEKVCLDVKHDEKYYAYNRISAYDPNMCSAARFSPPYSNEQVTETENIVLIPCTSSEGDTQINNRPTIGTSEICSTYTVPVTGRHYANEYDVSHQHYPLEQDQTTADDQIERQITQIILHHSPGGTLYQSYYVTNKVDLVPSTTDTESYRTQLQLVTAKEDRPEESHPTGYVFNSKISHNNELIGGLGDGNFVQLDHALIPELSTTYNAIPPGNVSSNLHKKDPQRLLLESTMSPLLAAVNDITQRDAELQSYLNQSFNRDVEATECEQEFRMKPVEEDSRLPRNRIPTDDEDDEDEVLVSDKPVESRARASLPSSYLYFGKCSDRSTELAVYAKREIRLRTKFGPFEGEIRLASDVISDVLLIQASNTYPLLLTNDSNIIDVSNENLCNWMRFVRLAKNFTEQNLLLYEESGKLYFKCCQVIHPKQELKVGYSDLYAKHYDLKTLSPTEVELREIYNRDHPWPCFECDDRFATSKDLQQHLSVHDVDEECDKPKPSRRKKKVRTKHFVDIGKDSIRCLYCNKVFMTNSSLKKHMSGHLTERRALNSEHTSKVFRCGSCYKKFSTDEKLKAHRLIHIKNDMKPYKCSHCNRSCATPAALAAHLTSHSLRYFCCVSCEEKFTNVSEFRSHIVTHSVNGTYSCRWCRKKYSEYHLVRKHVRIFHQSFKYSCNECGRKFPNMAFLKRHRLCHSEKYEYLCSQCGKQFKRKDKLREHIQRIHTEKRKQRPPKKITTVVSPTYSNQDSFESNSPYWNSQQIAEEEKTNRLPKPTEDYRNFMYKCDDCMLGFKRRGMLVNHMVKRHPQIPIESIPELNLPILKPQSLFYCQFCSKVYKSNAKRKQHILKNHPGEDLPPSARNIKEPSQINARTVGNLPVEPHRCHWCYKQYAARNRLVHHHRKAHPNLEFIPANDGYTIHGREYVQIIPTTFASGPATTPSPLEPPMDVYRPCSPENKLLKLSSAALELSSLEDRKFFDFLNEKSQSSLHEESTVDVNFKVVESEFGESSSNGELNRLPQLFEESIACI